MKDSERRLAETFLRVQAFGKENPALFPDGSFAAEHLAVFDSVLGELEKHAAAQAAGRDASRHGVRSKAAAREALIRLLEAINRTSRPMAAKTPGLSERFRVPHNESYQGLVAAARAIAAAALPLKAEFVKRGMPADFLEELEERIAELDEAHAHRIEGRDSRYEATLAIEEAIERGVTALRELDPLMRNTLIGDPVKLGAWLGASHVERPPRRNRADGGKPPDQDPQTGTSAPPSGGA